MSFVSFGYFIFLAAALAVYYIFPQRFRWIPLLAASAGFCSMFGLSAVVWLFSSTAAAYFAGLLIDRLCTAERQRCARWVLAAALVICFGTLFVIKFSSYLPALINRAISVAGLKWTVPSVSLSLPVGISFYLFQITGYLIDIYRRNAAPEKHIGYFALSVTFFAKLVQGPIEPVSAFCARLRKNVPLDPVSMRAGAVRILLGLCQKALIADRLAVTADRVFSHVPGSNALTAVIGAVFYSFQLYNDFAGYTNMALGTAQLFGIELSPNFRQPYLSRSIAEFWRRWHITLSNWLKEYVYFPLGGSRVTRARWALNVLTVFLVSGLWHGAGITFIVWGLLHGIYQIIGKFTAKPRAGLLEKLAGRDSWLSRSISVVCNFALVTLAWVFFRAASFGSAITLLSHIFTREWSLDYRQLGVEQNEFILSIIMIAFSIAGDLAAERTSVVGLIEKQRLPVRWLIYLLLLFAVILFGMYGSLSADSFIYVSF